MSSEEKNRGRAHEHSDWNLNWVVGGGITLVISVFILLLVSWWIFKAFRASAADRRLGTVSVPVMPPEPRLQISPRDDWTAMIEREQAILNSFGWVDRSRGIVRIPVEREMESIAQRGFPATRPAGGQTK